jgi:hypothetical protein
MNAGPEVRRHVGSAGTVLIGNGRAVNEPDINSITATMPQHTTAISTYNFMICNLTSFCHFGGLPGSASGLDEPRMIADFLFHHVLFFILCSTRHWQCTQ